jgi:hypothetical protein
MSDAVLVGLFVALCAGGMGYISILRRREKAARLERQRLRDSLTLIDTQLALKSSEELVKEREAARAKAVDDYNRHMWRPGSDTNFPD